MKIINDLVRGTGGVNEYAIVRFLRLAAIGAAIGGLDAGSTAAAGLRLPDPAVTIPLLVAAIAGAEKWLRNKETPVASPSMLVVDNLKNASGSTLTPPDVVTNAAPTMPPSTVTPSGNNTRM